MRGLYTILDKLSIHGLPYITPQHHGSFGRLIWLLCVLVSFSLAGLVIWSNVDSWRSQPTVVAGVEYSPIEDEPWMPQVIVCPTSLNSFAMLDGLLQATNKEALTSEILVELRLSLTKMKIMDRYYQTSRATSRMYWLWHNDLALYESCFEVENDIPEDCSLILVLAALLEKFAFHKAEGIIVEYAAKSIVYPDTADIFDYMSAENNISMADIYDTSPSLLTSYKGVLVIYMTFFDVIDRTKSKLLGPQPLNSYIKEFPIINLPNKSKLSAFLSWILKGYSIVRPRKVDSEEYNPIQELSGVLSAIWLNSLKAYLNVESNQEAILLMNAVWHGGLNTSLFQPSKNRISNGYMCNKLTNFDELKDFHKTCNNLDNVDLECDKYCKLLTNVSLETQSRIKEVLKMGFDRDTPATSSFQSCQHPTRGIFNATGCWKRVLNDRGALTNKVPSVMKIAPITLLLDEGQHIELIEEDQNSYRLETLEMNTNRRSVYVNVVPYNQNSVESMLYETEVVAEGGFVGLEYYPITRESDHHVYFSGDLIMVMETHIEYVQNSTDSFKTMDPTQKKCYLPNHEKKLKHFDEYSEADCMLECAWEIALKSCSCVPWYLGDMYPSVNLCEFFGNRCFQSMVKARYNKENLIQKQCQPKCLPNCDMIQYSTKKYSTIFSLELVPFLYHIFFYFDLISRKVPTGGVLIDPNLVNNYFSLKFGAIPQEVLELADNNTSNFMLKSNLFGIEMLLTNKRLAQRIVRTATMTTTDLISNVGGTLGLFCGMSVLSLVEIIYWASRTIWKLVYKKEKSSKRRIALMVI